MGISVSGGVSLPGRILLGTPAAAPSGYALWTWGNNGNGQLGDGTDIKRSSPVQVGALIDWTSKISKDAGNYGPLAIKTDNILWTWGLNSSGELGLGDTATRSSPVQIGALTDWLSIGRARQHVMVIKNDGTLWTWGKNDKGKLGFGDIVYRSSPVQLGSLTDWSSTTGGQYQSHAIKIDGTLWGWGGNTSFGQIGDGTIIDRSSPVQIGGLSDWAVVVDGHNHSLATKTDGTLWAWGDNNKDKLGLGYTTGNRSSPVSIGSLTDWASIAASRDSSFAIKTDGSLWAWGYNSGQAPGALGLGDTANRNSPVQVGALTDWAIVLAGRNTTLARKTDGTIWSWGNGAQGRTGLGDENDRSSPTQIGTDTSWVDIGSGGGHFLALKTGT